MKVCPSDRPNVLLRLKAREFYKIANILPSLFRWVLPNKGEPSSASDPDYWYPLKLTVRHSPQHSGNFILDVNEETFSIAVGLFVWFAAQRKVIFELTANYLLGKLPSLEQKGHVASILRVNRFLAFREAMSILARDAARLHNWVFDATVLTKQWRNEFIGDADYEMEVVVSPESVQGIPHVNTAEQIAEVFTPPVSYHVAETANATGNMKVAAETEATKEMPQDEI